MSEQLSYMSPPPIDGAESWDNSDRDDGNNRIEAVDTIFAQLGETDIMTFLRTLLDVKPASRSRFTPSLESGEDHQ